MLVPVTMYKSEKYAFRGKKCPGEKRGFFFRNFGCSRKVYNLYTAFYCDRLEETGYRGGEKPPRVTLPEVSSFKKDHPYLKEADSLALANAKLDFQEAVRRFEEHEDHVTYTKRALRRDRSGTEPLSFRGLKGMPRFHAKARGYYSYTTNCQYPKEGNGLKRPTVRLEGDMLYLPKLKDGIRLRIHRPLPEGAVIKSVTVSMDTDGAFYASVLYEYTLMMEMDIRNAVLSGDDSLLDTFSIIGLDYSQQDFYVDSEGGKTNCPHSYRRSLEKLARLQRELSRMKKDSNNYNRCREKIARLHVKIRNQRLDFVRKESSYLASRYDIVAVEDIDLRAMGQCLNLGKNLHDNGFGIFRDLLAKKLLEKGSCLVKVPRFFASSKLCHCCGYKNHILSLKDRKWTCPQCGTHHDRDINAAVNIREEGKRIFPEYFRNLLLEEEKACDRAGRKKSSRGHRKKAV